ncbi:MAG TPA: SPOR domain-containing protein [Amaricoccus sp.]|nr:SPOR domain-containing protein [Amaricoccus sp.]
MRDHYSDDDYESVAAGGPPRLIPDGLRRLTGAALFLALIAALGLWSYRLGTRDAREVPIIKAMAGPARIEPENPGGLQAAHQGLEVNTVLAGRPAPLPRETPPAKPEPAVLQAEDAPQGELVVSAPAILAERVLGESGDLPMPAQEDIASLTPPETNGEALGETPGGAVEQVLGEAVAALDAEPEAAPGPRPRNRPANLRPSRPAAAKPAVAEAKPPAPKPAEAAKPAATQVASAAPAAASGVRAGTRLVQLGAFDSEEITRRAWSQLVAKYPDLLSSKSLFVERTTANARVFYRLRVAGFSSSEETRVMCEALRSRGVACIPVTLQ